MPEETKDREIVHVIGLQSPQIQEEVAAVVSVLRSWGYPVRIIAPMNRPFAGQLASAGVPACDIEEPAGDTLLARWSHVREVATVLRDVGPMLLHAHGFGAAIASIFSRRGASPHQPLVISPHPRPHALSEGSLPGMRRRACRWALARSEAIIVPTETERDDLAELDVTSAERAETVPYSLSRRRPPPSLDIGRRRKLLGITSAAVVIGCVVDGLQVSDLESFIDAAAELCMEYPSLEFALIGRDVDNPACHELVHRRGLLGAAVFVDPRDQFQRAISSLNVLVTPQRGWPSGMLALQALAVDVGVIAMEGGEVEEMLGQSPRVTIIPADGSVTFGEGIIRQLGAASQRMKSETEPGESSLMASFLVSREFFDLDERWQMPVRDARQADAETFGPELAASFDPTVSARALIGIYQRLLDESESSS